MGRSIVKQPDGLYAIWSTVVDNFVAVNCTVEEVIQHEIDDFAESIRHSVARTVERIESHGRAGTHAPTFSEALKTIGNIHGPDELKEMIAFIADKTDASSTPTAQPENTQ